MRFPIHTRWLPLLLAAALPALPPHARAAGRQMLRGHVPSVLRQLAPIRRLPAAQHLSLAIALPLRNQAALTGLLRQLYDPASPRFRKYLTPAQFTAQFGPTAQDYEAVAAFAAAHRLTVTGRHPNRLLVDVDGAVSDIEAALHVTLRVYRHPTEARTFFAPDSEPSLDLAVPVAHISGLDNFSLPRPRFRFTEAGRAAPHAGSGPGGGYMGNDFRAAYAPGVSLTGSGQAVGLLQFDGYHSSDITYYEGLAGLPNVPLTVVLLDGFNGHPTNSSGPVEVSLDIENTISMAPGLSQVIVYEGGPNGNWHDILNRMASDDLAKQLSCSWYSPGQAMDPVADSIFQEMAAQGQSFYNASGDTDAYTGLISFPGDTPYITQVGGTTLTVNGTGGWNSETVWNWGYDSAAGEDVGSGGGISTQYSIPLWQQGVSMTANQGSATMRNTPDVALVADNVYVREGGANQNLGGTSCAAPLWAGFTALVNQQAAANGQGTVGFANPALYAVGLSSAYGSAFHDTTTGNNTSSSSPTQFYAVTGYDLCTGWGTPNGAGLINALALPAEGLGVSAGGFNSSGPPGGPFIPGSAAFTLSNSGAGTLQWSAAATQPWLSLSATGGVLAASGTVPVTASINSAGAGLASGTYSDAVTFTDLGTGYTQSRDVSLTVFGVPVISSTLAATGTSGAAFTYQIAATGSPSSFGAAGLPSGLAVNGASGLISGAPAAAGVSSVIISATNVLASGSATLTLTVLIPPPAITSPLSATATNGVPFAYQITASNGPDTLTASGLPSSLAVNSSGLISGTPTATGSSNIILGAANTTGSASADLALTVLPPPPVITSAASATGTSGFPFAYLITASNGSSYFATGLPQGLSVNASSGLISGAVATTGSSSFTIGAANVTGTATAPLAVTMLEPPPVITSTASASTTAGTAFSYTVTASNSPTAYGAANLPAGLSINSLSGVISGTATTSGSSTVILSATNSTGAGAATITITVKPNTLPVITSALSVTATTGVAFDYQITCTNGPASFSVSGLPPGIALRSGPSVNGLISGALTTAGTSSSILNAINSTGTGTAILVINAVQYPPPVITSATSATATQGQPFTYQIAATNSPTSYSAASLPAGLAVSSRSGLISGTWEASGTDTLAITASNPGGSGSASLLVFVQSPYAVWQSQYFDVAGLVNPSVSAATADPAGDGIPNLMKYALGLDPFVNGAGGLPVSAIITTSSGNYLTLSYTQVISAVDITYTVQVSTDLQNWYSGPGYTTPLSVTGNSGGATQTVTVQSAIPISGTAPQQYMQLQVTH